MEVDQERVRLFAICSKVVAGPGFVKVAAHLGMTRLSSIL
jgi:hypothetical protein